MPIYTYQCCNGHQTELVRRTEEHGIPIKCVCGRVATQVIVAAHNYVFKEQVFEDIAPKPIVVKSKRELERVCRKYGCYARNYMENYSPTERLIRYGA